MFHTIADFISTWQAEAQDTEKLLHALTDESLKEELIPGLRTIGKLAWHIIESPSEMLGRTGLKITNFETRPQSVSEFISAHQRVVQSVAHQVQSHWNNKSLHQSDDMYGEMWTRSKTLSIMLYHLIHHRGQMTVFMRAAGLVVPGIYGPAKEEWKQFGMEEPQE